MHKVHHSEYQSETDSNGADILSINDVRQIRFDLREYPREVATYLAMAPNLNAAPKSGCTGIGASGGTITFTIKKCSFSLVK